MPRLVSLAMQNGVNDTDEMTEGTYLRPEGGPAQDHPSTGWRPSYLRRRVLMLFFVGYCAILAALEVLNHFSEQNQGIASSTERLHYGWTYGPTAILTIFVALWYRAEFQAKQNAPWQAMLRNPEQPDKSLLLDYVSAIQPLAMWRAFNNKHFVVTIAIASSLILRLVIIMSTGLLSLQQVLVARDGVPVQTLNSFNTDNDSASVFDVADEPYDVVYAVAFENMSYAGGTNENFTFQQFSMPNNLTDALLTVNLTGLAADLDCEDANVTVLEWSLFNETQYFGDDSFSSLTNQTENIQISSSSCLILDALLGSRELVLEGMNNFSEVRFFSANCTNSSGIDGMRILITAAEMLKGDPEPCSSNVTDGANTTCSIYNITLARSKQMLCRPTFSLVDLQVQVNTTEGLTSAQVQQLRVDSILSSEMAWNIANEALSYTQYSGDDAPPNYNVGNNTLIDLGVGLGMYLVGFDQNAEPLFQGEGLYTAASTYYRSVTAQLTNAALSQRNESTVRGNASYYENRILVTQGILRAMEVCLIILAILNLTLSALDCHREIAPWSPHQISAVAAVVANSDYLRDLLRGTGGASLDVISRCLAGRRYQSRYTPRGFSIAVDEDSHEESEFDYQATTQAWNPFPNLTVRVCAFVVVAMMIAALEIVLHTSQAHNGLADVSNNGHIHYTWTLLPAVVMNLIAVPFMSINFNIKCIAPYSQLLNRATGLTFHQSLNLDFMDTLGVTNIFRSIRFKQFSILSTTLATMIAAALTIVSSGLFSAVQVPQVTTIMFAQEGGFAFGFPTESGQSSLENDQGEDIETAGYILRNNLSFPQWTYESLAFPRLSYEGNSSEYAKISYVDIQIPALRAGLSCKTLPMNEIPLNYTASPDASNQTNLVYNLYVGIYEPPCAWNASATNLTVDVAKVPPESYFGYAEIASCSDDPEEYLLGAQALNSSFIWGFVDSDSVAYAAELVCSSSAETVQTLTRFSLPGMEITPGHLPVTNESSAAKIPSFYSPPTNWGALSTTSGLDGVLDGFFQTLIYGKYALPIDYLGSSDHTETVASTIMKQYQSVLAQLMNTESRGTASNNATLVVLPGEDQNGGFVGNATDLNRLRLVQDAISTRILEALLGCMLLLGIISSISMNTDRVLPKNPCSIGAMASLLADSNFLDRYQHESNRGDPNNISFGKEVFGNAEFLMGWINNAREGQVESSSKTTHVDDPGKFTIYMIDNPK